MEEFSFFCTYIFQFPVFPKCRQQQELIMKLLQQAPQQQGPGAGGSGWSGASSSGLSKAGKPSTLALLEMQQEAERLLKQQQQQRAQQRDRVSSHSSSARRSREPSFLSNFLRPSVSLFSRSTQACQWAAPPWEASGWTVWECGPGLGVWRAKASVAARQAGWACGTRL